MPFALFHQLGMYELLIIGGVTLLIFGNRLPSVMRSLGRSVVEFKKGAREGEEGLDDDRPQAAISE